MAESLRGLCGNSAGHQFEGTLPGPQHPGNEDLFARDGGVAKCRQPGHARNVDLTDGWHAAFLVSGYASGQR